MATRKLDQEVRAEPVEATKKEGFGEELLHGLEDVGEVVAEAGIVGAEVLGGSHLDIETGEMEKPEHDHDPKK